MRIAIIADVHSNLAALETVLKDAQSRGAVDALWCLGDGVGYGPQPRQCLARLQEAGARMLVGNHDLAAVGQLSVADFNPEAAIAARWTGRQLGEEEQQVLGGLPQDIEEGA